MIHPQSRYVTPVSSSDNCHRRPMSASLRASLIHGQITRTLLQFPRIRDVRITIEGQRDEALEP